MPSYHSFDHDLLAIMDIQALAGIVHMVAIEVVVGIRIARLHLYLADACRRIRQYLAKTTPWNSRLVKIYR